MENKNPGGPRSKLDILYREVLGDVSSLVESLEKSTTAMEAITLNIATITAAQQALPKELSKHLAASMEMAARPVNAQSHKIIRNMLDETSSRLDEMSREAARYARIAHAAAIRMALLALAVGAGAGIIGGLLAVLYLGRFLGY